MADTIKVRKFDGDAYLAIYTNPRQLRAMASAIEAGDSVSFDVEHLSPTDDNLLVLSVRPDVTA